MKLSGLVTGLSQIALILSGTATAQAQQDPTFLSILQSLGELIGHTVEGISLISTLTYTGNSTFFDFKNTTSTSTSTSTSRSKAALADSVAQPVPVNSTEPTLQEVISIISAGQAQACCNIDIELNISGPDLDDEDCVQLTNLFVTAVNMNLPFLADLREEIQYQSLGDRRRIGAAIRAVRRACMPAIRSLAVFCPDQVNELLAAEDENEQALNMTITAEGPTPSG